MEPMPSSSMSPSPAPTGAPAPAPSSGVQSYLVWIIAAVIVIAAAAFAWNYYSSRVPALPMGEDAATKALETQSASDEISAIEEDLDATLLEDLDQELGDIDAELVQ